MLLGCVIIIYRHLDGQIHTQNKNYGDRGNILDTIQSDNQDDVIKTIYCLGHSDMWHVRRLTRKETNVLATTHLQISMVIKAFEIKDHVTPISRVIE